MHSVKSLHDIRDRPPTSYSFSHMTLQEFLAARYWSQLPPLLLAEILQQRNLFPLENFVLGHHEEDDDDEEMDDENEDEEDDSKEEDSDEEEDNEKEVGMDSEEEDDSKEENSDEEENSEEEDNDKEENSEEDGEDDNKKEKEDNEVQKNETKEDTKNVKKITHWPVLLFIADLTQLTHITELITQWAGKLSHDGVILAHPALCQLLFECQSPQLVSTVFSGRRVGPYNLKITSPLDWFVIGYCIAHCDTTSSWRVYLENSIQCLQAFSSGLHYSSTTTTHCRIEKPGSLTELDILVVENNLISPFLEAFHSLYPYTQAITILHLNGDLHSDDKGFPVLQELSHYCPKLRTLTLPTLHPPYSSLPHLPHTLDTLDITLPLMKDDSVLGRHLQQYNSLKHLILYGDNK